MRNEEGDVSRGFKLGLGIIIAVVAVSIGVPLVMCFGLFAVGEAIIWLGQMLGAA